MNLERTRDAGEVYPPFWPSCGPSPSGFCYHAPGVVGAEGGIEVGEALDKLLASRMVVEREVEREDASSGDTMLGLAHLVEKAEAEEAS